MTLLEQLTIGWKVCVAASTASAVIGGAAWTSYRAIDEWVSAKNRADELHSAALVDIADSVKLLNQSLSARLIRLEDAALKGDRNTETHCRLGTLPPIWCEDQGYKVPKQAPLAGAGG